MSPFRTFPRRSRSTRAGAARLLLPLALLAASAAASALDIVLPPETAALRPSPLPGYQLAQMHCMVCHSAQYVQTQPPGMPHSFWEATVKKMKVTYGAQFPDADIPALADYLTKTYGAQAAAAR
ncbi:MAG: cytochrome c [Burkholderiaceae bacterium]